MPIKANQLILVGVLVVGLLTASGLALHYKVRATQYQQAYVEASLHMDDRSDRSSSIPAPVRPALSFAETRSMDSAQSVDLEVEALMQRVQELEEDLTRRERIIEDMRRRNARLITPMADDAPPRDERDWMADLQERDPERYEEIMQRREQARQRVKDAFARQAAHFLYRDVDSMSEDELQEYNLMLGLLGETWRLSEQIQGDELSWEERRELRRTLGENMRTLRPLLANERDREFYEMGLQLGYDETGAAQFVDYINDLLDITSFSAMWGGDMRRGGRGTGPGPGR